MFIVRGILDIFGLGEVYRFFSNKGSFWSKEGIVIRKLFKEVLGICIFVCY